MARNTAQNSGVQSFDANHTKYIDPEPPISHNLKISEDSCFSFFVSTLN